MDSDDEMYFARNNMQVIINTNTIVQAVASTAANRARQVQNDKEFSGRSMIMSILEGHPDRCYNKFRMNSTNFLTLCNEIMAKGLLRTDEVSVEEQIGMFLNILGHSTTMRIVAEDFQHSLETVHRCFKNVLQSVLRMRHEYIKLPGADTPIHPRVSEGTTFAPFKDALGAIDGTYISCIPPPEDEDNNREKWRCRKGLLAQNVLAAVDFDNKFVYVLAGWEGAAHDNHVLQGALSRRRSRANRYTCPEDLYNHRHAQLRNTVEKAFGILKARFKILKLARPYSYKRQCKIVIVCCILHNFIKKQTDMENTNDPTSSEDSSTSDSENDEEDDAPDPTTAATIDLDATNIGANMRDEMRDCFWNNRTN